MSEAIGSGAARGRHEHLEHAAVARDPHDVTIRPKGKKERAPCRLAAPFWLQKHATDMVLRRDLRNGWLGRDGRRGAAVRRRHGSALPQMRRPRVLTAASPFTRSISVYWAE